MLLWMAVTSWGVNAQVSVWDGTHSPWTKGSGTAKDPFLIENAQQLAYLSYRVNNGLDAGTGKVSDTALHYLLTTDVDLNGSETFQWTPIGYWTSDADCYAFGGYLDGANHTVSGLYIRSTSERVGFFGYIEGGKVSNLRVTGSKVRTTGQYAGGLAAYVRNGEVHACSFTHTDTLSAQKVGGLVGGAQNAAITNGFHDGVVSGYSTTQAVAGGIVGLAVAYSEVTVFYCRNTGKVSAETRTSSNSSAMSFAGGVVGNLAATSMLSSCSNTGSIHAVSVSTSSSATRYAYAGGIVGRINASTITNCYNRGTVFSEKDPVTQTGTTSVGGIAGVFGTLQSAVTHCYQTGALSASLCGGIVGGNANTFVSVSDCFYLLSCGGNNTNGGVSVSSEVMKTAAFVENLNQGGCTWKADVAPYANDGYPLLSGIQILELASDSVRSTQTCATLKHVWKVENDSVLVAGFRYKAVGDTAYTFRACALLSDTLATTLSGLLPSTTYTFQAYLVTAGCDTSWGAARQFSTRVVSVSTLPVTEVTASSATLNGRLSAGDALVTGTGFRYRKQSEGAYTTVGATWAADSFAAAVSGLSPDTRYECQAFVAFSAGGEEQTLWGDTVRFFVSWLNEDTIDIDDAAMLRWVAERCNTGESFAGKYIRLTDNIILPLNVPNNMLSIGSYPDYPFQGTFDGNGKQIVNLYIDEPNTAYQGFFGYTLNANLYEVGLVNITASGRNYTGGMVAYADNTTLRDCYVNGGSLFALSYCGGLVGYQAGGTRAILSGCYNTCTVSGNNYVGGLVGYSDKATVRNSYVAASVAAQGKAVGAIIGGADEVLMYHCYFNSNITGQSDAIGENNFKAGDEGMTDAEMRDSLFVATLNQGLVTPVWKSDYARQINKGFPILIWQHADADTCGAGMEEAARVQVLHLYPNPTDGLLTVSGARCTQLQVFDVYGKRLGCYGFTEGKATVDLSCYAKGVYVLKALEGNRLIGVGKVVRQ